MIAKHFVVIGSPITHSLSPEIHHYFAQQTHISLTYEKMLGDEQLFEQQVSDFFAVGGKGMNITLPFKERAFALAQKTTSRCQLAGAANTLWVKNNQLHGDNTDGIGFIRDISRYIDLAGKNIVILGAGGAARGIIAPLLAMQPASLTVTNRSREKAVALQGAFPQINYVSLDKLSGKYEVIINATSAGLEGKTLFLPEQVMAQHPFCYDLSYDLKEDTPFVFYAKNHGCKAMDGMGMLVEQAAEAFFIWNEVMPKTEPVLEHLRHT